MPKIVVDGIEYVPKETSSIGFLLDINSRNIFSRDRVVVTSLYLRRKGCEPYPGFRGTVVDRCSPAEAQSETWLCPMLLLEQPYYYLLNLQRR